IGSVQTAGVLKAVHLGVEDCTSLLDPPIVSATNDLTVLNKYRADRYATFGESLLCFFNRSLQKLVHSCAVIVCETNESRLRSSFETNLRGQDDRHRSAVEQSRLVLPLFDAFNGCIDQ